VVDLRVQAAQVRRRDVVDVQREDLERELGVRQPAPARERGRVDTRVALGQVQPAVGRQAFEQDLAEAARCRVAAGAEVSQLRSSLRIFTIGARTVGSACIFASASRMRPSTVSCVRMIRSVLVAPGAPALALARAVVEAPGLRFAGLQAYQGAAQHLRSTAERREAIARAAEAVRATRTAIEAAGLTYVGIGRND